MCMLVCVYDVACVFLCYLRNFKCCVGLIFKRFHFASIRGKPGWSKKIFDEAITAKYTKEAVAQGMKAEHVNMALGKITSARKHTHIPTR